jgi:hypothetical protein
MLYSTDGYNFTKMTNLPNINSVNGVKYLHNNPLKGNNFYRIVAIDRQNNSHYSDIKVVKYENTSNGNVYPNPATDFIYVTLPITSNNLNYIIADANGKTVQRGNYENNAKITITQLSSGTYNISIVHKNNIILKQQFIKK